MNRRMWRSIVVGTSSYYELPWQASKISRSKSSCGSCFTNQSTLAVMIDICCVSSFSYFFWENSLFVDRGFFALFHYLHMSFWLKTNQQYLKKVILLFEPHWCSTTDTPTSWLFDLLMYFSLWIRVDILGGRSTNNATNSRNRILVLYFSHKDGQSNPFPSPKTSWQSRWSIRRSSRRCWTYPRTTSQEIQQNGQTNIQTFSSVSRLWSTNNNPPLIYDFTLICYWYTTSILLDTIGSPSSTLYT